MDLYIKFLSEISFEELKCKGGYRYIRQLLFVIDWAARDNSVYGDGGAELVSRFQTIAMFVQCS